MYSFVAEKKYILSGIIFLIIMFFGSCSSLQAGLYLISIEDDGDAVLENEPNVRKFLEYVIDSHENYLVRTFARTGISAQIRRTRLMTHTYFVIICINTGEYHTLSFYGTKFALTSRGAWAMNAHSDKTSYMMYLNGDNRWDVGEIYTEYIINVRETITNIIKKMDRGITYYYRDHIRKRPNVYNCNTAIYGTVVLTPRSG